ncbi:MAG: hypothetical protein NW207_03875 [Cytophagales bacterium]|nr:hypothetical protein [Cytophagales bacterium]
MQFDEYLISKKIDKNKLQNAEPQLYQEFEAMYALVSTQSFTQQKLFLINAIRRKYKLDTMAEAKKSNEAPKPIAPKMPFKPKMT